MARIQILELPTRVVGEFVETPFALIVDGVEGETVANVGGDTVRTRLTKSWDGAAKVIGAVGAIVSDEPIEIVRE